MQTSRTVQSFILDLYRKGPSAWDSPSDMPSGLITKIDGWWHLTIAGRELGETLDIKDVLEKEARKKHV